MRRLLVPATMEAFRRESVLGSPPSTSMSISISWWISRADRYPSTLTFSRSRGRKRSSAGWLAEAALLISNPRHLDETQLDNLCLLRQQVVGLVAGYEHENDPGRMRTAPVLKLSCRRSP